MKKLLFLLPVLAVAAGLASCEKETTNGAGDTPKGDFITTVSATSGETTRVTVIPGTGTGGGAVDQVLWATGDKIVFFEVADEAAGTYVQGVKEIFSLVSGEGTKSGVFVSESGDGLDPAKAYKAFHVKDPSRIFINPANSFIHFNAIPSIGSGANGPKYAFTSAGHNIVNDYAIFVGSVTFPDAATASVAFGNSLMSILEFQISLQIGATDFAINEMRLTESSGQGNNFFSLMEIKGTSINSGYSGNYAVMTFETPFNASDNEVIRIPVLHRFTGNTNPYNFTLTFSDANDASRSGSVASQRPSLERGKTYVWPIAASTRIDYTLSNTNWNYAGSTHYGASYAVSKIAVSGTGWLTKEVKSAAVGTDPWNSMPQWALIDLGSEQTFNYIKLGTRGDVLDPKNVNIWVATNYTGTLVDFPKDLTWTTAQTTTDDTNDDEIMRELQDFVDNRFEGFTGYWNNWGSVEFTTRGQTHELLSTEEDFTARYVLIVIEDTQLRADNAVAGSISGVSLKYVKD